MNKLNLIMCSMTMTATGCSFRIYLFDVYRFYWLLEFVWTYVFVSNVSISLELYERVVPEFLYRNDWQFSMHLNIISFQLIHHYQLLLCRLSLLRVYPEMIMHNYHSVAIRSYRIGSKFWNSVLLLQVHQQAGNRFQYLYRISK